MRRKGVSLNIVSFVNRVVNLLLKALGGEFSLLFFNNFLIYLFLSFPFTWVPKNWSDMLNRRRVPLLLNMESMLAKKEAVMLRFDRCSDAYLWLIQFMRKKWLSWAWLEQDGEVHWWWLSWRRINQNLEFYIFEKALHIKFKPGIYF